MNRIEAFATATIMTLTVLVGLLTLALILPVVASGDPVAVGLTVLICAYFGGAA